MLRVNCMSVTVNWHELCFCPPSSRGFLSGVSVVVGEFDQRAGDEDEQFFLIKSISVHEKYQHAFPMSYDIALIELDQRIRLGRFLF